MGAGGRDMEIQRNLGRVWEQQGGHEVARNMIFIDFGLILGPHLKVFWVRRLGVSIFVSGLFPCHFEGRFLARDLELKGD